MKLTNASTLFMVGLASGLTSQGVVRGVSATRFVTGIAGPVSSIPQDFLDTLCRQQFTPACEDPTVDQCNIRVARHTGEQNNPWVCVAITGMDMAQLGYDCVGPCGELIPCLGKKKGDTRTDPLTIPQNGLQDIVEKTCPAPQKAANQECSKVWPNTVARKGTGHSQQRDESWRCYSTRTLQFEYPGVCINGCGQQIVCAGGTNLSTEHYTRTDEIQRVVQKTAVTCQDCISRSFGPPICPESIAQPISELQGQLDEICKEKFKEMCNKTKHTKFCSPTRVVARKGFGNSYPGLPSLFSFKEWRCYDFSIISLENDSTCVNKCGQETPCLGGAVGAQHTHYTLDDLETTVLENRSSESCEA